MRAGTLRKRMLIQTRGTGQDTSGAQVTTWTDLTTVWAEIEPLTGAEKFYAGAQQASVTHTVTVRYQAAFASPLAVAAMRGVYKGRYFNFAAPMSEGESMRQLVIPATEGMNAG